MKFILYRFMKLKHLLSSLKSSDISTKRVLLRIDANVPLKRGIVADDFRIRAVLPTVKYLARHAKQLFIVSHLGDPKGKRVSALSLLPVKTYLEKKLNLKIDFVSDIYSNHEPEGKVVLFENIRFFHGEEKNSKDFAKVLASYADLYVNDAFSVSHRDHASVSAITQYLPSYSGFLLESELANLDKLIENPKHPFVCILGGAKPETKIPLLKRLAAIADSILIAGVNVYPFYVAADIIKKSQVPIKIDASVYEEVSRIWARYRHKIILPIDCIVSKGKKILNLNTFGIRGESKVQISDIGPMTVSLFNIHINAAGSIYWNGPLGIYEESLFKKGSVSICKTLATRKNAVIGGGDTAKIVSDLKLNSKMAFISTGGGASLQYLSGQSLPGLKPFLSK